MIKFISYTLSICTKTSEICLVIAPIADILRNSTSKEYGHTASSITIGPLLKTITFSESKITVSLELFESVHKVFIQFE